MVYREQGIDITVYRAVIPCLETLQFRTYWKRVGVFGLLNSIPDVQGVTIRHQSSDKNYCSPTGHFHLFGLTAHNGRSHSLWVGGATTMKLNGHDSINIKKTGHWSTDTFLTCTHSRIGALTPGLSPTK